jgi:two-component system chemotaxis sensor kinase CheA
MDDLLNEFLTETNESLSVLDVELVKLEQNPNDPDLLSNIFRLMHTIKGTCGFLGLPRLEAVAHAGENVLGKVRDGELEVTPVAVSLILECLDQIRVILMVLEETEAEPEGDDSDLIGRLNALASGVDPKPQEVEVADQALELCEAGMDYDVIISDIEMPNMDGFDFAQEIRANSRWSRAPLLALSSHANPQDLARGRSAVA